jgi:hypothetical protein
MKAGTISQASGRHAFVTVMDDAAFSVFGDLPEFQAQRHIDLQIIKFAIHDLTENSHAVLQFNDANGIGRLVDEGTGSDVDDSERFQNAFAFQKYGLKTSGFALVTNQTRWEKDFTA